MIQDSIIHQQPAITADTPATASQETSSYPSAADSLTQHTVVVANSPIRQVDASITPHDTVAADTIAVKHVFGVTLTPPPRPKVMRNDTDTTGMSVIVGGIMLLFCVIGIRFHHNRKYIRILFRNLIDMRVRHNLFDETVRETSFMVLLNLLWSCSAGVLLYALLRVTIDNNPVNSFGLPGLVTHRGASIAICMGVAMFYTGFMTLSYLLVGNVFADKEKARLWLKGFTSGQSLLSFVYFLLALLYISHPEWAIELLWVAAGTLILAKIVFIWKGFRIFFTQISSWVLFLYYLCSLEIVPLILTYLAAILLCGFLR